ncbi:Oxysterol-binding protein-related protein 5 [Gracilariopsis chorda]|uniref:Oxysterol-binding protein-related protein 5 n=1 Tax=Gracilariopsis chorda TaxID=448386 RepID=A0A2V3J0N2_9FLOR|nr:Oxysterol-binding protein-related protein 5 [Gracilariopsis chorda]|eukprot:PXF47909.1 Oxysterol-binding protein-related protein 5 [Gracilariopsis chorda]
MPPPLSPPSPPPLSDEEAYFDARDTLSSSDRSSPRPPVMIPVHYSRIEPLPSPQPPPGAELSIFRLAKEMLTSVKPGADVTNINLPASILDPVSTLEKAKKSMQRGELLQDLCAASDPESRMLNVIRFNLSGLAKERFGKKPYNPVLGEVYRCAFAHKGSGGETLLVAEQVSHHPPITALHLHNDTLGFQLNSHTAPEPRFWGNSLEVKLKGEIRIVLSRFEDEQYVITRPYVFMSGFLAGRQRLEFNGTSSFKCARTGLAAEIEYHRAKGPLSARGEMNAISGRIYKLDSDETVYTLAGHWDKKVHITHVNSKQQRVLFDYEAVVADKSMLAICPPAEQEEPSFSTRIWADCSTAISNGDTGEANAQKRRVEDHQRRLKKERNVAGIVWKYRYFIDRDNGDGYELLPELRKTQLVKLDLEAPEIEGLRSGELVKQMHMELMKETESSEGKGRNGGRRRLLSRRGNNKV